MLWSQLVLLCDFLIFGLHAEKKNKTKKTRKNILSEFRKLNRIRFEFVNQILHGFFLDLPIMDEFLALRNVDDHQQGSFVSQLQKFSQTVHHIFTLDKKNHQKSRKGQQIGNKIHSSFITPIFSFLHWMVFDRTILHLPWQSCLKIHLFWTLIRDPNRPNITSSASKKKANSGMAPDLYSSTYFSATSLRRSGAAFCKSLLSPESSLKDASCGRAIRQKANFAHRQNNHPGRYHLSINSEVDTIFVSRSWKAWKLVFAEGRWKVVSLSCFTTSGHDFSTANDVKVNILIQKIQQISQENDPIKRWDSSDVLDKFLLSLESVRWKKIVPKKWNGKIYTFRCFSHKRQTSYTENTTIQDAQQISLESMKWNRKISVYIWKRKFWCFSHTSEIDQCCSAVDSTSILAQKQVEWFGNPGKFLSFRISAHCSATFIVYYFEILIQYLKIWYSWKNARACTVTGRQE